MEKRPPPPPKKKKKKKKKQLGRDSYSRKNMSITDKGKETLFKYNYIYQQFVFV